MMFDGNDSLVNLSPQDLVANKIEASDWAMADLEDIIGDCRRSMGCNFDEPMKPTSTVSLMEQSTKSKHKSKGERKHKSSRELGRSGKENKPSRKKSSERRKSGKGKKKSDPKEIVLEGFPQPVVGEKYFGSVVTDIQEETLKQLGQRIHKQKIITFDTGMVMKEDFYTDV